MAYTKKTITNDVVKTENKASESEKEVKTYAPEDTIPCLSLIHI